MPVGEVGCCLGEWLRFCAVGRIDEDGDLETKGESFDRKGSRRRRLTSERLGD